MKLEHDRGQNRKSQFEAEWLLRVWGHTILAAHFQQEETFSAKIVIGLIVRKLLKGVEEVLGSFDVPDPRYPGGNPDDPDWIFSQNKFSTGCL